MLKINCHLCGHEIEAPGALIFTPPVSVNGQEDSIMPVHKIHICLSCWMLVTFALEKISTKLQAKEALDAT